RPPADLPPTHVRTHSPTHLPTRPPTRPPTSQLEGVIGVAGGQVIGSSDSVGEGPKDRPVTPADLAATIYTLLGIDPQHELQTDDGRPVRVAPYEAEVITEIVT
ncbi:MAG: DUF1501 domain-containing protein, partial [Fuerstiella sp.]|nr:DUF1501 domain-containing protein [Fuerstiella sp.]